MHSRHTGQHLKHRLGMSPFQIVYGKCHLSVEMEHRAYWATRMFNIDSKIEKEKWMLQLSELDEFRNEAYENARIYKEKTKAWHERHIARKEFEASQRVLLFTSRLKLFLGKLKSRWSGPFTVTQVFPYGGAEIMHPEKGTFKVKHEKVEAILRGRFPYKQATIQLSIPGVGP